MSELPVKHNPYLHDLIWDLLKDLPRGALLDIPSGPGYFAKHAAENGFDSIAAEIDESLHFFPEVDYRKVDMSRALPFDDGSFDYIVSIEGIEHVENQFLFLRECFRILKDGGRLMLTSPNTSSLENRFTFFLTGIHETPTKPIRDDLPNAFMEHTNLIPFYRLETYLRFAGFKIERLETYRYRKGSRFMYPFVYPIAWLRFRNAFKRFFKDKAASEKYQKIIGMYLSKEVLCGSHIVVVAQKPR
jgi:2-polyprenyl-3-methyl-5-hydroxy-6-metoxy-1,4-benzoquinol methylase